MKYFVPLFVLTILAASCYPTKKQKAQLDLHGSWTMTSYVAFMPSIPEFEKGDVVWDFDTQKSTVNISKKNAEKHRFSQKPGKYGYTIKDKTMTIDGRDYFYSITEGVLRLDNNTDPRLSNDLPVITFARM